MRSEINRREIKRLCSQGPTMDFRLKGACLGGGNELFFQPKAKDGGNDKPAKDICATCRVRDECLAWGICHEKHGVWGGQSENQRRKLRSELGVKYQAVDLLAPSCGTDPGYQYHIRHGEEPCKRCRWAHATRRRAGDGWGMASRDYLVNENRRKRA